MRRAVRCMLVAGIALAASGAAATPPPPAVEADAQAYTQIVLRHDQLLFRSSLRRITPEEEAEMPRLRAAGEAIKAKYGPGRAPREAAVAFTRRIHELSREVIAPAARRWVVDAFPEPEAVTAAYPVDLDQAAAMQILARTLAEKVGQPPIAEATAKIDRYRAAWARINPQSRPDHATRLDWIDGLRRSKQFVVEVLERFVPIYAPDAGNALRRERRELAMSDDAERYRTTIVAVVAVLLALPFLSLLVGEGRLGRARSGGGPPRPFELPPELGEVRVFRRRFPVAYRAGEVTRVAIKEYKQEISRSESRAPGFVPARFTRYIRTETEYHLTLTGPDGVETGLTLAIPDLPPREGELYSVLLSGRTIVLTHNHSSATFHPRDDGIRDACRMRFLPLWLAGLAVEVVGFLGVARLSLSGAGGDPGLATGSLWTMTLMTAPLFALYLGVLKLVVQAIRVRQFRSRWQPRFAEFMREQTAPLDRCFRAPRRATSPSAS